jgi:hypothetical protein
MEYPLTPENTPVFAGLMTILEGLNTIMTALSKRLIPYDYAVTVKNVQVLIQRVLVPQAIKDAVAEMGETIDYDKGTILRSLPPQTTPRPMSAEEADIIVNLYNAIPPCLQLLRRLINIAYTTLSDEAFDACLTGVGNYLTAMVPEEAHVSSDTETF